VARQGPSRPLRDRIVTMAGRFDDTPDIAGDLVAIAVLCADRISPVAYASVTSRYEGAYATVAASSDLALQVDNAQYAEDAGPCLDAVDGDYPVAVPEISTTMTWPGFRDVAFKLGLRASLSIPLFAARGTAVAALNLYAHDPNTMKALTASVWSVYESDVLPGRDLEGVDEGGEELVTGLAGAFAVQARIQRSLGVLMSAIGCTADEAFAALHLRAVETDATVTEVAERLLGGNRW
jgi:hypothetical protein